MFLRFWNEQAYDQKFAVALAPREQSDPNGIRTGYQRHLRRSMRIETKMTETSVVCVMSPEIKLITIKTRWSRFRFLG